MKNNQLLAIVTGLFFLCSVVTIYNVWNYHKATQQLVENEAKANYVRGVMTPTLNGLLYDVSEYSKKNPAVVPILQALTNSVHASSQVVKHPTK